MRTMRGEPFVDGDDVHRRQSFSGRTRGALRPIDKWKMKMDDSTHLHLSCLPQYGLGW